MCGNYGLLFRSFTRELLSEVKTYLDAPIIPDELGELWEFPEKERKFWDSMTPWFVVRGYVLYPRQSGDV